MPEHDNDSVEGRLARVEAKQNALLDRIDFYHSEIVKPLKTKVDDHDTELTIVKRDRLWVSAAVGAIASWAQIKFFGKG